MLAEDVEWDIESRGEVGAIVHCSEIPCSRARDILLMRLNVSTVVQGASLHRTAHCTRANNAWCVCQSRGEARSETVRQVPVALGPHSLVTTASPFNARMTRALSVDRKIEPAHVPAPGGTKNLDAHIVLETSTLTGS